MNLEFVCFARHLHSDWKIGKITHYFQNRICAKIAPRRPIRLQYIAYNYTEYLASAEYAHFATWQHQCVVAILCTIGL